MLTVPSDVSSTDYLLSTNQPWMSVANADGEVSGTVPSPGSTNITVTVSTNGLAVGNYVGTIANDAPGVTGWTNVTVNLNVVLPPAPTNLYFKAVYKETPSPQNFNLVVPADVSSTAYLLGTNQTWLSVADSEGEVSGTVLSGATNMITVSIVPDAVSPTELSVGRHTGTITVGSHWLDVPVIFDVVLKPDPTNLSFNARYGDTAQITNNFALRVPDDVSPTAYLLSTNQPWLSVANAEGEVSGTVLTDASTNITVVISPSGLSVGGSTGTVTVGSNWLDVTVSVAVDRGLDAIWFSGINQTYNGSAISVTATSTHDNVVGLTYNGGGAPTDVGTYVVTGIVNTVNWTGTNTATLTIIKATPAVTTWPTASAITCGQTLADSELSGGAASVAGAFAFDSPGTKPDAGTYTAAVTFTPTDTDNYNTVAGTVNVTVDKATPAVTTWPTASAITCGQTLADSELSGGAASVAGAFAFDSPGTKPDAGTYTAAVTFTPTDTDNYNTVAGTVSVNVQEIKFVEGDFDNDGAADPYAVIGSNWYIWFSGLGYQLGGGPFNFGAAGTPVAADFDGDGAADPAMVAASGEWYIWFSSLEYQLGGGPFNFGAAGTPVAADFDGDGAADPAMVVNGKWTIWMSLYGYVPQGPFDFSVSGADPIPLAGDFDGDGAADPAMVVNGKWTIWMSLYGYVPQGPFDFSVSGADPMPMAGDFDGDGAADPAMVVDGNWTIWMSLYGYVPQGPFPFMP
ncbi:MAG: MBG domain-containing protein [Kiritimatiellae bacterium]|nr:MBG domain-containing protein [Kiritimatiellia bacterium]